MKTLHLLRHAKSSWVDTALPDFERPLNKRGKRDAPRMGEALAGLIRPLPITASTAQRAQLTLGGLCDGWPALTDMNHRSDDALYTFASEDLLAWLATQDDADSEIFIIGHNPGFTDLINYLCEPEYLDNLPTAGYAQIALACESWARLPPSCGELRHLLVPKQLR